MLLVRHRIQEHVVVEIGKGLVSLAENGGDILQVALGVGLDEQVGVEVDLGFDVLLTSAVLHSSSRTRVGEVDSAVFTVKFRHFL